MNDNLEKMFEYYCENEVGAFLDTQLVLDIKKLAIQLEYSTIIEWIRKMDGRKTKYFLSIEIRDKQNNFIDIWDDGDLSYAIEIIIIDKRGNVRFQSWTDPDFIETVLWIKNHLENFVAKKVSIHK